MCKPARLNTGARQRHATRGKLLLSAELDGNIWSRAHVGEREQDFTGIWGFGFCRFMNLDLLIWVWSGTNKDFMSNCGGFWRRLLLFLKSTLTKMLGHNKTRVILFSIEPCENIDLIKLTGKIASESNEQGDIIVMTVSLCRSGAYIKQIQKLFSVGQV